MKAWFLRETELDYNGCCSLCGGVRIWKVSRGCAKCTQRPRKWDSEERAVMRKNAKEKKRKFTEEVRKAKFTNEEYNRKYYLEVLKPRRAAEKPYIIHIKPPAPTTPTIVAQRKPEPIFAPEPPRRPEGHIADERIIMAGVDYAKN